MNPGVIITIQPPPRSEVAKDLKGISFPLSVPQTHTHTHNIADKTTALFYVYTDR